MTADDVDPRSLPNQSLGLTRDGVPFQVRETVLGRAYVTLDGLRNTSWVGGFPREFRPIQVLWTPSTDQPERTP